MARGTEERTEPLDSRVEFDCPIGRHRSSATERERPSFVSRSSNALAILVNKTGHRVISWRRRSSVASASSEYPAGEVGHVEVEGDGVDGGGLGEGADDADEPDSKEQIARPTKRDLELERIADRVPPLDRDAHQRQHRHRHRQVLKNDGTPLVNIRRHQIPVRVWVLYALHSTDILLGTYVYV